MERKVCPGAGLVNGWIHFRNREPKTGSRKMTTLSRRFDDALKTLC